MRARPLALLLAALAAGPARAEDAQPAAADVQAQLRAALGPMGGDAAPPEQRVQVTQEGDHLRIAAPALGLAGRTATDAAASLATTATARLVDGKWDVEDIKGPASASYAVKLPDGKDGVVTVARGEQTGHALFDPTFATASSLSLILTRIESATTAGGLRQAQRIDSCTVNAGLAPRGDGRLDVTETADLSGIAIATQTDDHKTVEVAIGRGGLAGSLEGVNKDRAAALLAAVYRLGGALTAGGGKLPALDPAVTQDLLQALDDFAAGGKVVETADDVRVAADGKRGGADHVSLGLGATAAGGDMAAYLDLVVDGLSLPDTPQTAGLTPRHIAIRPSVSGIDMRTLTGLIRNAAGPDADMGALAMQAIGLVASGRLRVGVDSFALDLGDARFDGEGAVNIRSPSPKGVDGAARVTAQNFDAFLGRMQARAQSDENVAKMIPQLVYAKGLARTEDGKLVWAVAYAAGRLTVNGVDPTGGAAGKAPAQPPSKR